jgi:nitroreductase
VVKKRRSIRHYQTESIPKEDIRKILEAAILAPSGNNAQPWQFLVITNPNIKEKLGQAVHQKLNEILEWPEAKGRENRINAYRFSYTFFDQAPVVIAVLGKDVASVIRQTIADHGVIKKRNRPSSEHLSIAAAIENLLLAATDLGYGSCWMTGPLVAADEIEKILEIEPPWYIASLIPLGKAKESPPSRPRRPLDEVSIWLE